MYNLIIKEEADKIFKRLSKKNRKQLTVIWKKTKELQERPFGYKFLRKPLQGFNRVHIDKHFVLIFTIDHNLKIITIHYFGHHDKVYQWLPRK